MLRPLIKALLPFCDSTTELAPSCIYVNQPHATVALVDCGVSSSFALPDYTGCTRVVLDMSRAPDKPNRTWLEMLFHLSDRLEGKAGGAWLVGVPPKIMSIFEMLEVDADFQMHKNREEALRACGLAAGRVPSDDMTAQLMYRAIDTPFDPAPIRVIADYLQESGDMLGEQLAELLATPELRFVATWASGREGVTGPLRLALRLGVTDVLFELDRAACGR